MASIAALLADQVIEDRALQQLADMAIEGLKWRIFRSKEELLDRSPDVSLPEGDEARHRLRIDLVAAGKGEEDRLRDWGISRESAHYLANALGDSAVLLVAKLPDEHKAAVTDMLRRTGVTKITEH